jgi:hypothetical protein
MRQLDAVCRILMIFHQILRRSIIVAKNIRRMDVCINKAWPYQFSFCINRFFCPEFAHVFNNVVNDTIFYEDDLIWAYYSCFDV